MRSAREFNWCEWLVLAIAAITVVSGLVQAIQPGLALGFVGAESTPVSRHFFGIVGMFMVFFGGALFQGVGSNPPQTAAVFWTGLQKLGASAAVALGVSRSIFSGVALLVAGFDLTSGILIICYWWRIRKAS